MLRFILVKRTAKVSKLPEDSDFRLKSFSGICRLPCRLEEQKSKYMNISPRVRNSFAINGDVDICREFPIPHNWFFTPSNVSARSKQKLKINSLVWGQCMGIKKQPWIVSPACISSLFGLRAQSIFFSSVVRFDRQMPRDPLRQMHSLTVKEHDTQVIDARRGADSILWR